MLGKYGTIYKNYLKEYKRAMYNNLKSKGKLEEHCYQRELELKECPEDHFAKNDICVLHNFVIKYYRI